MQDFVDCLYGLTLWEHLPNRAFYSFCEKFYMRHMKHGRGYVLGSAICALQRLQLQPAPELLALLDEQVRLRATDRHIHDHDAALPVEPVLLSTSKVRL